MSDNTFTCDRCGGTFPNAWTEEEAEAELARDFPGFAKSECGVLCDDCHAKFTEWHTWQSEPYTPPPIPEELRPLYEEYQRQITNLLLYGDSRGERPKGILPA